MKKKEVRDLLFENLSDILAEYEFRQNKKEEYFSRKILGGEQRIGIPLWDFNPEYEFSLGMSVRIDSIEALIARSKGASYTSAPNDAATTYTRLGYFLGPSQHRYKVRSAEDIAVVMKALTVTIKEKIIPFLDRLTTAEAVERLVNADATGFEHHSFPQKALTGLAAASLTNRTGFESIAARYDRELTALNFNKMDFDEVRKLTADIRAELESKKQGEDH